MQSASYSGSALVIEDLKNTEFFTDGKLSFRAQIKKFNGRPFVGLVKFFYQQKLHKWLPSGKQFFMPVGIWAKFAEHVPSISDSIDRLGREDYGAANMGFGKCSSSSLNSSSGGTHGCETGRSDETGFGEHSIGSGSIPSMHGCSICLFNFSMSLLLWRDFLLILNHILNICAYRRRREQGTCWNWHSARSSTPANLSSRRFCRRRRPRNNLQINFCRARQQATKCFTQTPTRTPGRIKRRHQAGQENVRGHRTSRRRSIGRRKSGG